MPLKSEPVLFWDWLVPARAPVGRRLTATEQLWPQSLTILGGNSPRTEQVRYIIIIIIIIIIIRAAMA